MEQLYIKKMLFLNIYYCVVMLLLTIIVLTCTSKSLGVK